jgi:Sec-independent protein secretion pathway components
VLDFSWAELLLIIAVAVLVIGPKEIPVVMRSLGRIVRRLQYVRFAFSQQFDDFMKEHDLEELRGGALVQDNDKESGNDTSKSG